MNVIVFQSLKPRDWCEQELFFIKVVAEQLSTLFYQEKVREELIRTAQVKSDFLAKMSHELRTPLNTILGYTKMIQKGMAGLLNPKQCEYISYVAESGEHLHSLVNDLLDFSKIEAGKMTLVIEPVDIETLISEVKVMMHGLSQIKSVNLSFQIQPGIGIIEADPARFKQIMINLITNAVKFNHPGGTVSVRLNKSEDGTWLTGEVQDTGTGIAKDRIPELFTKFHQIDNSSSRRHEGTGLGLVLTKELLELHGGRICIDSEEGVGSTFTFSLPVFSKAVQEDAYAHHPDC
jgi:signal transduction histidine kinase